MSNYGMNLFFATLWLVMIIAILFSYGSGRMD
jgi:hypothetical protein